MPMPPVGGMPYSRAVRKSSSTSQASSSPAAFNAAWASKRLPLVDGVVELAEGVDILPRRR